MAGHPRGQIRSDKMCGSVEIRGDKPKELITALPGLTFHIRQLPGLCPGLRNMSWIQPVCDVTVLPKFSGP